jgi:hypothetical protein
VNIFAKKVAPKPEAAVEHPEPILIPTPVVAAVATAAAPTAKAPAFVPASYPLGITPSPSGKAPAFVPAAYPLGIAPKPGTASKPAATEHQ